MEENLALALGDLGKAAIVATAAGWAGVKDVGQVVVHTTAAGPGLTVFSESFDSAAGSQAPVCLADQWVWLWRHAKDAGLAKPLASLEVPGQVSRWTSLPSGRYRAFLQTICNGTLARRRGFKADGHQFSGKHHQVDVRDKKPCLRLAYKQKWVSQTS